MSYPYNDRSLLQKSPIKETVFYKRDPFTVHMCVIWHHSYVSRDPFTIRICVTWPIRMCHVTHPRFKCAGVFVTWPIPTCRMTHSHFKCVCVCVCVMWLIHMSDTSHPHIHTEHTNQYTHRTHKSIYTQNTQINLNRTSSVNPRSTSNQLSKPCIVLQYPSRKVCVTWLIYMFDTIPSFVWRDSFICVMWMLQMCDMTHSYV